MRPPAMVSDPFPPQEKPWVHRCHEHGCRMRQDETDGRLECPVCAADGPIAQIYAKAYVHADARMESLEKAMFGA